MKRFITTFITLFILTFFFLAGSGLGSDYTVKKGDSLSKIAKKELGDWRKWRVLAEINNLEVVKRHVHIVPGQKLKLKEWTENLIDKYQENTMHLLKEEIFSMKGLRYKDIEIRRHREIENDVKLFSDNLHLHRTSLITFNLGCQYEYRMAQLRLKKIITDMANMERLIITEEIFDYTETMPLHFFKDKPWIARRKTAALLLAIITTESHGRFVKGKHGERGIYQQKPETFRIAMGYKKSDLPEIEELLMTSHYASMKCAIKLLERGNSPYDALRRYNAGEDGKDKAYARKVMRTFKRLLKKVMKMDRLSEVY